MDWCIVILSQSILRNLGWKQCCVWTHQRIHPRLEFHYLKSKYTMGVCTEYMVYVQCLYDESSFYEIQGGPCRRWCIQTRGRSHPAAVWERTSMSSFVIFDITHHHYCRHVDLCQVYGIIPSLNSLTSSSYMHNLYCYLYHDCVFEFTGTLTQIFTLFQGKIYLSYMTPRRYSYIY